MNHYDRGMSAFDGLFVPAELRAAVSARAWLEAMLDAERALVNAGATCRHGAGRTSRPRSAAACDPERFDFEQLVDEGRAVGNLGRAAGARSRGAVGDEAARYVHRGATSQDIVDTAAMLVSRRALALVLAEADDVAAAAAALARDHRDTLMVARTLLQHAVPTTFGLKAAGWLTAIVEARARLERCPESGSLRSSAVRPGRWPGSATAGSRCVDLYARELELAGADAALAHEPDAHRRARRGARRPLPVSRRRSRSTSCCSRRPRSARWPRAAARGGSSTMPQKRNPVGSTLARASARLAAAHAGVLVGSLEQEHERAAGAWQAEWDALAGALALHRRCAARARGRARVAGGRRRPDARRTST